MIPLSSSEKTWTKSGYVKANSMQYATLLAQLCAFRCTSFKALLLLHVEGRALISPRKSLEDPALLFGARPILLTVLELGGFCP